MDYVVDSYGKSYKVSLSARNYTDGNLAIRMDYFDGEVRCWLPFANLTVNLGMKLDSDCAFLDVNNCPWARDFVEDNGLGESTGLWMPSGFCEYPLYRFKLDKIKEARK